MNQSKPYFINFNTPVRRGTINNKLSSTFFIVEDSDGVNREVQFDEIPQSFSGVSSIGVINPGKDYTSSPTITISGDGVGATAAATIVNGAIESIQIVNRGIDYTRATVTITGGGEYGATAEVILDGRTGQIRTVYYDVNSQRQIINENAGTIDYDSGTITISNILIKSVSAVDGLIRLSLESEKGIISTVRSTILSLDQDDPISISTTLETA